MEQTTSQRLRLASSGREVLLLTLLSLWQETTGTALLVPDDWRNCTDLRVLLRDKISDEANATLVAFDEVVNAYDAEAGDGMEPPALTRQVRSCVWPLLILTCTCPWLPGALLTRFVRRG